MTGSESDIVRIDCSEYAMSHEYAKLIGAPPGYIGHSEGGYLTEAVKNKPNGVVVFDEIEKAHEKVHNLLLQLLDEGILTDSKGETVNFRETVIILTTNIGVSDVTAEETRPGFRIGSDLSTKKEPEKLDNLSHEKKAKITRKSLEKNFPPEFLNRIDDVIVFRQLDKKDNLQILSILLKEVSERIGALSMHLGFTDELKNWLIDKGTDLKYGARPLRRTIQRYIENPLAEQILKGDFNKGDDIIAEVGKDEDGDECTAFRVIGKVEIKEQTPESTEAPKAEEPKKSARKPKKKEPRNPTEKE